MTFIDETEGLSNTFESGSESDTPFPPSEDQPSVSVGSTSSSHISRSAGSPSLSSIRLILDSEARHRPRSPQNVTSARTMNTPSQHDQSFKSPISTHDDFAQLPSPDPSTGKAITEDDSVVLNYEAFPNSIAPPLPSIYLDTPVWPLTDPSEAVLLRHFVQNLATWVCGLVTSKILVLDYLITSSWTFVTQCNISRSKFLGELVFAPFYWTQFSPYLQDT